MNINFTNVLTYGMFFLPLSVFCNSESSLCNNAKFVVSSFVQSQKNNDWDVLEYFSLKSIFCKCEMAPVLYFSYRLKMLLPNSHAMQGISPNDFILSQKLKMDEQIKILKACDGKDYKSLINAMTSQNFDEQIANSASELKRKLKMI